MIIRETHNQVASLGMTLFYELLWPHSENNKFGTTARHTAHQRTHLIFLLLDFCDANSYLPLDRIIMSPALVDKNGIENLMNFKFAQITFKINVEQAFQKQYIR